MAQAQADKLCIGFLGLGLIGGSIARACKRKLKARIVVFDASGEVLEQAKKARIADHTTTDIDASFAECSVIFLSAPASHNLFNLRMVMPYLRPDAVLTDVSSVKGPIHRLVKELQLDSRFVGGHPMTGSEKSGFSASGASLLNGACYILTKTPDTDLSRLARMETLVRQIGAEPLIMTAMDHDRAVAYVSHLPHVVSAELVRTVEAHDDERHLLREIAAGGFKDLTRISSSSPELWRQIAMLNASYLSGALGEYITGLQKIKKALDKGDAKTLEKLFTDAQRYRSGLEKEDPA